MSSHVWQKAHRFALDVYNTTRDFAADERFGDLG
jgi:hypothetical protein